VSSRNSWLDYVRQPFHILHYSANPVDVVESVFIGRKDGQWNGLSKEDLVPLWYLDEGQMFRRGQHQASPTMTLVHRFSSKNSVSCMRSLFW